ncbi:MAG: hypothetical protein U0359_35430 [Byssovorax sp.]
MKIFPWISLASLALAGIAACSSSVGTGGGGAGGTGETTSGTSSSGTTASSSSSSGTGGSAKPCDAPPDPQAFEIGTGELCFERLAPMQEVPMMQGPQGGFHVWLAVGCMDCGAKAVVAYGVKDPATGTWLPGTGELKLVLDFSPGAFPQHAGITDFLPGIIWDPMSVLAKGTHVILSASVLDDSMKPIHSGEVEVVLGDTVMWSPPCDTGPNCGAPGSLPCCTDGKGDVDAGSHD